MNRSLICISLALSVVAAAAAVQAQSFHPELAGPLFCHFRAQGIPRREAVDAALRAAWDSHKPITQVSWRGQIEDSDVARMTDFVMANCRELF